MRMVFVRRSLCRIPFLLLAAGPGLTAAFPFDTAAAWQRVDSAQGMLDAPRAAVPAPVPLLAPERTAAGGPILAPPLVLRGGSLLRPALSGPVAARPTGRPSARSGASVVHGEHLNVSRALIDPMFTHHAILEDEFRVSLFARSARASDAREVATLEVAYAFSDAIGAEVFLPYTLRRADGATGSRLLDIEAQPFKWSFVRRSDLIMTVVAGVVIPVGPTDAVGERTWRFEPHLFTDAAVGPFALQGNLIASFADNGEHELELLASVARMFFFGTYTSLGPLVETLWEIPLIGGTDARVEPMLAPGLKLQLGGWYFGASYAFPVRSGSDALSQLALTAGYHVSFSRGQGTSPVIGPDTP